MERSNSKLNTLMHGEVLERIDEELGKVLENIMDEATDPTKPRKIVVTIPVKANKERDIIHFSAEAKSTLAPRKPSAMSAYISAQADGSVAATRATDELPGTVDLFTGEATEAPTVVFATNK